jgi:hypothetical protein
MLTLALCITQNLGDLDPDRRQAVQLAELGYSPTVGVDYYIWALQSV